MIVFINGPFGVGKTSVSNIIKKHIDNSMIFDPEEIGGMLRKIIPIDVQHPIEKTSDFQDFILWRQLTVVVAKKLIDTYNINLVIPMTIYNLDYYNYIMKELEKIDMVFHFCLLADKKTIESRLLFRGEKIGGWPFKQIDKCLNSFLNNINSFEKVIYTDNLSIDDISSIILQSIYSSNYN